MQELSSLDVLVVDCQTTGATPAHGVVLEIGWGIARAAGNQLRQLESHWITLPADTRVPLVVRRLTGFDPSGITHTLSAREAWQRLRTSISAGVSSGDIALGEVSAAASAARSATLPTAIHFAQFELPFLRDWAARFEPELPFPLDVMCVHAIARRLFPELPRRSIRALAGFLGHSLELERRCLGHITATGFIWNRLVAELHERGVRSWSELGAWLAAPPPARAGKRQFPLPRAVYRALPDEPGVYRFLRSNGDVLYVGKAASLRKRVAGHFTAGSATSERALEMLSQVSDIRATPTATALEAALLENEEIKSIDPPYNVALLDGERNTWFFDRGLDSAAAAPDQLHRRGPLPSTQSVHVLRALQALLGGEAPTPELRARAVGAPQRWAPDERVFHEGYVRFCERHALTAGASDRVADRLLLVARHLLASAPEADVPTEADAAPERGRPGSWDPERVLRHLERGLAHAHQLLQRSRWLCLLHDSDIVFQEATRERERWLSVRAGRLVEARDTAGDAAHAAPPPYRSLSERQASFDRSQYDRLRTLTSELKRVLRDGGTARVRIGRSHWLPAAALAASLRWI